MTNLSNAMGKIKNAENVGKKEVMLRPVSKLIRDVLDVILKNGYIGGYEYIDGKGKDSIKVKLIGKINRCAVITPRFPCKYTDFERFEKRYLPAKNFGIIVLSTPFGVMNHVEAKSKKIGGVLLAYVY